MKAILSLIISGALVVSGFGQTRNVLVGTNNAVVQPTNFWSADASNARIGLGLGPTDSVNLNSVILSNGSASNPAIRIGTTVKGIYGAGNTLIFAINSNAIASVSSSTFAVNGDIFATNVGQTRTNFGLVWEGLTNADASSFRTALGLGTAATNPASAFQPSSANLTNLAANNGGSLTNLQATNLVGVIPSSNIATVNFSNLSGTLSVASGGTGATNASDARQNLGSTTIGDALFTATNTETARTAINALAPDGNAINLTNFPSLLLRTTGNGSGLTNLTAANIVGTVGLASNVSGVIAISNGGSGATTASGARTSLGLGTTNEPFFAGVRLNAGGSLLSSGGFVTLNDHTGNPAIVVGGGGISLYYPLAFTTTTNAAISRTNIGLPWSGLTNVDAAGFRSALGLSTNNNVFFNGIVVANSTNDTAASFSGQLEGFPLEIITADEELTNGYGSTNFAIGVSGNSGVQIKYSESSNSWGSPVLTDGGGNVVRPTNFWQVAPISTTVQDIPFTTSQTNNATNSRNLYLHSVGANSGTTHTILLPTNSQTFNGDIATIIHQGTANNSTAVRQSGGSTNLIILNKADEAVSFYYKDGFWNFNHNLGYVEPIYFSGTNAAANAAASRTNLGLGANVRVSFGEINVDGIYNDTEEASVTFDTNDNLRLYAGGSVIVEGLNDGTLQADVISGANEVIATNSTNWTRLQPSGIDFGGGVAREQTQRNLFTTNSAPTNAGNFGDHAAWMGVSIVTNGVTNVFRIPLYK